MGWANHEGLWRANEAEVMERNARVRQFYTSSDPRAAWDTLQRYRVTHVVLGDMERRTYPNAAHVAELPFLRPVVTGETAVFAVEVPR